MTAQCGGALGQFVVLHFCSLTLVEVRGVFALGTR